MRGVYALTILATAIIVFCVGVGELLGASDDEWKVTADMQAAFNAAVAVTVLMPVAMELLNTVIHNSTWTYIFGADAVVANDVTTSEPCRTGASFILFPKNAHSSVFHVAAGVYVGYRAPSSRCPGTAWCYASSLFMMGLLSYAWWASLRKKAQFLDHVLMEIHGYVGEGAHRYTGTPRPTPPHPALCMCSRTLVEVSPPPSPRARRGDNATPRRARAFSLWNCAGCFDADMLPC